MEDELTRLADEAMQPSTKLAIRRASAETLGAQAEIEELDDLIGDVRNLDAPLETKAALVELNRLRLPPPRAL